MNTRKTQRSSSPSHSPPSRYQLEMNTDFAETGTAAVSVFAPIAAPVVRSVDPVMIVKFLKECESYELEILSKKADLPTLKALSYSASIDRTLL
eukprot:IDg1450t1